MPHTDLTMGLFEYETTHALFDGSVTVEGVDAEVRTAATLPEIFVRLVREAEFDVAELGWTFYLRSLDHGAPYLALPAFPNRVFRHSAVFVNVDSGIERPEDLVGRTLGEFGTYGQDPGVWVKGMLMEEHGFDPLANRWLIGGLDRPMAPFDFTTHPHPDALDIAPLGEGQALGPMLEAGEIDALFTANVPQCVLDGTPRVRRLFVDHEPVERAYFERTGVFPANHLIVMPRELVAARPGLATAVYEAFLEAKEQAADRYRRQRRLYQLADMLPWTNALYERDVALLGEDWWPYGVDANRPTIDAFLRHHHEQGLSSRRWTTEEIFAPELLGS